MENVLKFVLLAVGLIIVGILIANVVSIYTTGKSILDLGKNLLSNSTATFTDVDKTQYEDSTVNGSQVVDLIKQYWVDGNTVAILVCTKDGACVMYDYSGGTSNSGTLPNLAGFPTNDACSSGLAADIVNKVTVINNTGVTKQGTNGPDASNSTFDANTGYSATANTGTKGYINRTTGVFQGKVQYDNNGNIRCLTFVQK